MFKALLWASLASVVVALIPSRVVAQATLPVAPDRPWRVLVAEFTDSTQSGNSGAAAAREARQAFAIWLGTSRCYTLIASSSDGALEPGNPARLAQQARAAGANACAVGEVAFIQMGNRRDVSRSEVGLKVTVIDVATGDPISGAAETGTYETRGPAARDRVSYAARSAGRLAARDVAFNVPIEGIIPELLVLLDKSHTLVSRGWEDGVQEGMLFDVIRNGMLVTRIRITTVFAQDSEAVLLDNTEALRPLDTVRQVFKLPDIPRR